MGPVMYSIEVNQGIHPMAQFKIAKLRDDNNWQVLECFNTYDEADDKLDFYSDKFPHAYIDILEPQV